MLRIGFIWTMLGTFALAVGQGEIVGEILVKGNELVSETSILAVMETKVGQIYQASQLRQDQQTLEALNYFSDVKVWGQRENAGQWRVVVEVVEWPVVRTIIVKGATVVPVATILERISLQAGEQFRPSYLEPDARAISDLYRERGYFARVARFEPTEDDAGAILIEIVEVRVNRIIITGPTRTKPSVMRKLMDVREGDLFHLPTWNEDLRRVYETRWFETLRPDSSEPELGKVDLFLDLREARTGLFNVGLSLDPRNNLAGILSMSERNLYGTGKSVGIYLLQSTQGLGTSFSIDYGDPFIDDHRTTLNVSLFSRETLVFGQAFLGSGQFELGDRFSQRRTGGSFSLSRPISKRTRLFATLRGELIDTQNFEPEPSERVVLQDGTIAGFELGVVRNRRDNSADPARGDWIRLAVEPSFSHITSVGGETSGFGILGQNFYTRATVDYRIYWSPQPPRAAGAFDEPRRVIAARAYAGNIQGKVPFFEQFFIGGANGVRGYAEDRYWGRTALLFQLEYRHPIQKAFNAVVFADYGGAWDGYGTVREFSQKGVMSLHFGYGVGINFRTPFGPIRLDVGFGEDGKARTHFLIGGSF
ncbi:MAG: BamA/TamA family outer membrane protein [Armatimonadetes bacterium]|nr:BamA/TamA family outer membrane protein [Armatimonadota bacterium]